MKLKCLIVDDEPIARKGMEEYIKDIDYLELIASCEDAIKANAIINQQEVHLIFLDIQMPKLNGIEFLRSLKNAPAIIFTTAYPNYALEGYELDVIDYLVKPIPFSRFLKAVNKARDFLSYKMQAKPDLNDTKDYFFLKADNKFEKLFYHEVLYIEGTQNYVTIYLDKKKLLSYITLSILEKQLPAYLFMRIHKSYIVSLKKINAVDGNMVIINNAQIPISRNLKEQFLLKVVENKLLKR